MGGTAEYMHGTAGYMVGWGGGPCDYCVTPSPLTRIWTRTLDLGLTIYSKNAFPEVKLGAMLKSELIYKSQLQEGLKKHLKGITLGEGEGEEEPGAIF